MSQVPRGQFHVEMPDGLVIERLPVGHAHGHWRVWFVAHGVSFATGKPPRAVRFLQEFYDRVTIEGIGGDLNYRGGGSGGGDGEQEVHMNYLDDGLTGFRITYRHDGEVVASEVIDLVR